MLHIAFAIAAALALPKYWTVHIDTPRADARAEFEKTDVEFYGIQRDLYAEHHVDRPPVVVFSADGVYYGLRPRAALADIEKPSTVPEDVRKLISEKTAPVSERTHRAPAHTPQRDLADRHRHFDHRKRRCAKVHADARRRREAVEAS
jgi:hypothetical protein